jgi:DnaJ domain
MIRLASRDTLIQDLIGALEDSSGGAAAFVEFGNCETGFAILQLASGRAAFDGTLKPNDTRSVNGQTLSLKAIAARFLSEKMLRPTNTHYAVLGLAKHCDDAAISAHFRRLISIVHPDANPAGYPADAAIQVNLANTLLANAERRSAYDESLVAPPAQSFATQVTPFRTTPSLVQRGSRGVGLRAATQLIRSRSSLIWGAGALIMATLFVAFNLLREPTRIELIVAKPNAKGALEKNAPSSDIIFSTDNALINRASSDKASTGVNAPPSLSGPTSTASVDSQQRVPEAVAAVAVAAAADARPVQPTAERGVSPAAKPTQSDTVALNISRELGSFSNKPAMVTSLASERRNPEPQQRAPEDADDAPTRALDRRASDEFLATFADAVEVGQPERFARLFGRDVAGRSEVLRGFEQLFQNTQKRQIRYVRIDQFRDKRGLWAFSGQADLATLSRDGASVNHRLFVSGTLVQRGGQVQLASWTSHPISAQ